MKINSSLTPFGVTPFGVFCCLLFALPSAAYSGDAYSGARYHFTLKKGGERLVCKAYQKRLNSSQFIYPPYCDRPEGGGAYGFKKLNRVFLGNAEVRRLSRQVSGFLQQKDIHMWEKIEAERRRLGVWRGHEQGLGEESERDIQALAPIQRPFRFDPPVDVDNDGVPDEVVMWREMGYVCGTQYSHERTASRAATFAVILNKKGNIDRQADCIR